MPDLTPEERARQFLGRRYSFPGASLAEQYQSAVREGRDVARALLDTHERLEAAEETICVERDRRSIREKRIAREGWQAAVGQELQSDQPEFDRWWSFAAPRAEGERDAD